MTITWKWHGYQFKKLYLPQVMFVEVHLPKGYAVVMFPTENLAGLNRWILWRHFFLETSWQKFCLDDLESLITGLDLGSWSQVLIASLDLWYLANCASFSRIKVCQPKVQDLRKGAQIWISYFTDNQTFKYSNVSIFHIYKIRNTKLQVYIQSSKPTDICIEI